MVVRWVVLAVWLAGILWLPAKAAEEEIVLTLRNPNVTGIHGVMRFSRRDLAAMEQVEIRTGHDFIDGVATYRGPRAADLIAMIGQTGASHVRLTAANDFWLDVELSELARYDAILALEENDRPLTLRDRGPVMLMYPIDGHKELQDPGFNNRLIWQLRQIELR